jgi:hypothetical protein
MNHMMKYFKQSVVLAVTAGLCLTSYAQDAVPKGWHLKDRTQDGYYGISLDKAYELVKVKKAKRW